MTDSRETDPNHSSQGNNIDSLLRPDGGTCRLMMGFKLQAPRPKFSREALLQYQIDLAMVSEVAFPEDPVFKEHKDESRAWVPVPKVPNLTKTPEKKPEGQPLHQWQAVTDAWSEAPQPEKTVALCTDVFGWGKGLIAQLGKKPKVLIDHVDQLCLEAPLLGLQGFKF